MDLVRLANPAVLLLAGPVWAVLAWAALRRPRRPGAALRAGLAALAGALLLASLAEPSVRVGRRGRCPVVIALDASPSVRAALGRTDPARVLAPWMAPFPVQRRRVAPFAEGSATDIAAGLRQAAAALPQGQGVVLLYTDARETTGDAVAQASHLAAAGIAVHAIDPALTVRDAAIVSVETTPSPAADRPLHLTVRTAATSPISATLHLTRAAVGDVGPRSWQRRVALSADTGATVRFTDGPLPAGRYRYDLDLRADADACEPNNHAHWTVTVGGRRAVYYVHAGEAPGPLLQTLRRGAPAGVHLVPWALADGPPPTDAAALVLENVPAWSLGRRGAESLARRVTDAGLGLWVLGGDAAFAAGAYADSPLEAVLPVRSRVGERPPLELVLVLDASGSMNETVEGTQKLALAKRAVLALRPALGPGDRVGVVAFAGRADVISPLAPLEEWDGLRRRLLALRAGGGTRITPAVEAAARQFPDHAKPAGPKGIRTETAVRHVLLLSDGRSEDFDVDRLLSLARTRRVSISAVATGAEARRGRLDRLASGTGGRLYEAVDLARLMDTFLKDLVRARGEGLRDGPCPARWVRAEPVWPAAAPPLPAVPAWNLTRAKDGAAIHWVTAPRETEGEPWPLLATWRRGLGKVAAMPWPAGTAPEAWQAAPAARNLFRPLLDWLAAGSDPRTWSARTVREGTGWAVRVQEDAGSLVPSAPAFAASVLTDQDAPRRIALKQVRPGVYEGAIGPVGPAGAAVVVHREGEPARVRLAVAALAEAELLRLGVDRGRLAEIVRAGGGQVHASPESFAQTVRQIEMRGYRPVGIWAVAAAGLVVLLLAALRLLGRA